MTPEQRELQDQFIALFVAEHGHRVISLGQRWWFLHDDHVWRKEGARERIFKLFEDLSWRTKDDWMNRRLLSTYHANQFLAALYVPLCKRWDIYNGLPGPGYTPPTD